MRKTTWLATGAFLAVLAAAPAVQAQTLQEALAHAYLNHPTLLAQRAQLRATDENVPAALSGWRPTVRLAGEAGRSRVESSSPRGDVNQTLSPVSVALSVSQPLYTGGRVGALVNQAESGVKAQRAALVGTEQSVLLNVANAYVNVVRDQAVLELNIRNVQVLERQLEATRDRYRVGEITMTDVAQAEARVARSIADRVAAEGNLQASRAAFVNAVGFPPETLTAPAVLETLPQSLDQATDLAASRNPTVLTARFTAQAASDGIDAVKGELYPTVALTADLVRSDESGAAATQTASGRIAVEVAVPLYQGGGTYARLRQQKHTAGQRRLQVDETQRNAVESAAQAWELLSAARARRESYSAQIKAAQIALEGVQREAQVGSRTVLDVLDAEQELLDARVNLVRAQRDEVVAAFQLKAAVGQLTAQELGLDVPVYDPSAHYLAVRDKWFGGDIGPDEIERKQGQAK